MASQSSLGLVSVAAMQQYLRLAEAEGLDAATLCREAGLTPSLIRDAGGQIPGTRFQCLLEHLINTLQDPILGLRSGDFVQPGSYNVLGYITMSCATLGEAIERIKPYEKLVGDMGVTTIEPTGGDIWLGWHCGYTAPHVRRHLIDNVFASWINYGRWLAGRNDLSPLQVELEHALPEGAPQSAYTERWHCPVRFGQGASRLRIPQALLHLPLRQPDPMLRRTLEEHAHLRLASLDGDQRLATQVRNAIYQQLRAGVTRQDMVAEQLSMNTRTLQRRLSEEGLSYQKLLDGVRQEMAQNYLRRPSMTTEEIALHLGFSDVRSFHRRFKTWTGVTPGEFRQIAATGSR